MESYAVAASIRGLGGSTAGVGEAASVGRADAFGLAAAVGMRVAGDAAEGDEG